MYKIFLKTFCSVRKQLLPEILLQLSTLNVVSGICCFKLCFFIYSNSVKNNSIDLKLLPYRYFYYLYSTISVGAYNILRVKLLAKGLKKKNNHPNEPSNQQPS